MATPEKLKFKLVKEFHLNILWLIQFDYVKTAKTWYFRIRILTIGCIWEQGAKDKTKTDFHFLGRCKR